MKKLLIAALIAGSLTLTACDDKEKNALIEQTQKQAQMIEQLNTQVDTLQKQVVDLAENQTIRVEPEVLFEKSETIKFDKTPSESSDDYAPESAEAKVSVKTIKTNMDWLTDLLINELIRQFTTEGQIGYYGYSGGAHGMYSTQFLNIDLTKKTLLDIDDVINPDQHDKLKELLWETYSNASNNETFTPKSEFYVEKDFYFSHDGITFIYPPYAIGSFAEGEKELTVYWWELKENKLLSPQFQNLTQYMMDVN